MKNKIFKILFVIAIAISCGFTNVFAADETVSFHKRDLQGVKKENGVSNTYYKTVDTSTGTRTGYCLNMGKKSPADGSKLTRGNEITSAQYVFFFENGFNGSSYNTNYMPAGLTNDQAYYATQLAIWIYQGSISADSLDKTNPAVKGAIQLYEASKLSGIVDKYMTIAIRSFDMHLNEDGTLYVSDEMHMTGYDFDTYQIYVDGILPGAKLVKADGSEIPSGSTLNFKDSFYLQMDASKVTGKVSMKVRSEATSKTYSKIYSYTSGDSTKQDIGILIPVNDKLQCIHTLNIVPTGKRELIIYKQDAISKADLAGATLAIKDAKGSIVQQWVTDGKAHVIKDLAAGSYTLVEIAAPEGYELSTEVISFTLAGDSYSKEITMLNRTIPTGKKVLNIYKKNATTKADLAGATLAIKDANGNIIEQWVTDGNVHVINDLPAGDYSLVEIAAPEGYEIGDGVINFTLVGDNYSEEVIMYNSPIPVTADINFALIISAFVIFLGFGVFGLIRASKKEM